MAAAFADIMSLCGVWLGGRRASVVPGVHPTSNSRGSFHEDYINVADPDLIELVRREVERCVVHKAKKVAPTKLAPPVDFNALPLEPGEAEAMFARLFSQSVLDTYFSGSREAFRAAAEANAARVESEREADIAARITAQFSALRAQDEEDIAAILVTFV